LGLINNIFKSAVDAYVESQESTKLNKTFNANMPYLVEDKFNITRSNMFYKNINYLYDDVKSIWIFRHKLAINGVKTSDTAHCILVFDNNIKIEYVNNNYFKDKTYERYEAAFSYIKKVTFQSRIEKIFKAMSTNGYIDIPDTDVKLYGNGTITQNEVKLSLKHNSNIEKGYSFRWGMHYANIPTHIKVRSNKRDGLFYKTIAFDLSTNSDCFFAIIDWLIKEDNVIPRT